VGAHDEVLIKECARKFAICPNASNLGREVQNHFGTFFLEQPEDIGFTSQIALGGPRGNDVMTANLA
jgi:hypothetical protein